MPNATVGANAQPLPASMLDPNDNPSPPPSVRRRVFLGGLAALFTGAAGLAGTEYVSRADAAAALVSPEEPIVTPAVSPLAALDAQLAAHVAERDRAHAEQAAATERFYAICPPRPRELIAPQGRPWWQDEYTALEFNISTELHNRGPGASERQVFHLDYLERDEFQFNPRSGCGRWIAKRLRLARQFEAAAAEAHETSGYNLAKARADELQSAVAATVEAILAIEPVTVADCKVHARAIVTTINEGFQGSWVWFQPSAAPRLLATLARLS